MPNRFGWGDNGGDTLGDVKLALGGRAFGTSSLVYAISPAKTTVDASKGGTFFVKMPATSVVKIGNPSNDLDGSEMTFIVQGITSFGTIVWDTKYKLAGAFATFSTAKLKTISFRYVANLDQYIEVARSGAAAVTGGI